jgi:hypothetical protein
MTTPNVYFKYQVSSKFSQEYSRFIYGETNRKDFPLIRSLYVFRVENTTNNFIGPDIDPHVRLGTLDRRTAERRLRHMRCFAMNLWGWRRRNGCHV